MQDKSINNALLELRRQIVRGRLSGLAEVEALLALRQVALPRVPKRQASNSLPRRAMADLLIQALKDGPKNGVELAAYVAEHRPAISYREAQARVHQALARMATNGVAVRDGRVWRLAR